MRRWIKRWTTRSTKVIPWSSADGWRQKLTLLFYNPEFFVESSSFSRKFCYLSLKFIGYLLPVIQNCINYSYFPSLKPRVTRYSLRSRLCVCVSVYVSACMWVCVFECVYVSVCIWVCIFECVYLSVCIWVCVFECVYLSVCIWVCAFECVYVSVWVFLCMCECVQACACVSSLYNCPQPEACRAGNLIWILIPSNSFNSSESDCAERDYLLWKSLLSFDRITETALILFPTFAKSAAAAAVVKWTQC